MIINTQYYHTVRNDRPDLRNLNTHVVQQQAIYWEKLGVELGLEDYHIANISKDNEHNPNRSVTCCDKMFQKWLEIDPEASWGKLDNAIKKIKLSTTDPVSAIISSHHTGTVSQGIMKGGNYLYCLKQYNATLVITLHISTTFMCTLHASNVLEPLDILR